MLSEMPDGLFEKITVFKELSDADMSRISQATAMLRTATGFYETPRLRKAIDKWLEDKRVEVRPLLAKHYADSNDTPSSSINGNIFGLLPSPFNMQDLRQLKGNEISDSGLYTIIFRWKAEGWVEKSGKSWVKKV